MALLITEETTNQTIKITQVNANFVFWWKGKTGIPREKSSRRRGKNQQTQQTFTIKVGIQPGLNCWKANFLTIVLTLLPMSPYVSLQLEVCNIGVWAHLVCNTQCVCHCHEVLDLNSYLQDLCCSLNAFYSSLFRTK